LEYDPRLRPRIKVVAAEHLAIVCAERSGEVRMTFVASEVQYNPARKKRPKQRRLSLSPFDKRTRAGRRAVELAKSFRERLNADPADKILAAAIEKAARLIALSEDASAKALNGDPRITLDDVVRLARLSDLAVKRLKLDERKQPAMSPLMAEIVAEQQAKWGSK
jgi:hypothetical protein